MEDLIRRSEAIEAIELVDWYHQNRNKDIVSGANSREHQAWYKAEDIYKALEAVPAVKPKRGKWIVHKERAEISGGFIDFFPTEYECSNCGLKQSMYFINSKPSNFCPNCGADMRERESE